MTDKVTDVAEKVTENNDTRIRAKMIDEVSLKMYHDVRDDEKIPAKFHRKISEWIFEGTLK